ncbi:AAA family ATPase [Paenibacillus sacheonensis]|uniref:AAA family ATPase n=1 Tax=Paenibacillus sacheonensis TaxID=742054 RepID=A0A7X4YT09_9BACL|nr:AAA family ATPase [Paenibacillus sacheonensis]MBM7567780.1 putative kinase [Paenibacillus sacheonensis]NBC71950.1 AAA family ATPase [Paenibacillus sacheonensis]
MLYIFGGLPGTGKSTLSSALAKMLKAAYLRVDIVEQAMRDAGMGIDGPEGYMVCYALASQQLRLGLDVIADTVNPILATRQAWRGVAESLEMPFVEIEVICSDNDEHRHRIETREVDIPRLVLPTWEQVVNRHYDAWDRDRIVIDTANRTVAECLQTLIELSGRERNR